MKVNGGAQSGLTTSIQFQSDTKDGLFDSVEGHNRCQESQDKVLRKGRSPGMYAGINKRHLPDVQAIAQSSNPDNDRGVQNPRARDYRILDT